MLKKRRNQIILGIVIALICFGIWYIFIRDVDVEENKIAAPDLSLSVENPCAAPSATSESTVSPDATLNPDEVAAVVATPQVLTDRTDEDYRLYVFEQDASKINFEIVEFTDINGTFDMFGHWFEFIYIPEEDGWCATLWLDIDGQSVDTGNDIFDNLMIAAFQAERYPVGRFVGAATALVTDLSADNAVIMSGQLELTGVVKDFEVPIQFSITDDQLIASAAFDINANDFGANLPGDGATLASKITVLANKTDPSTIELAESPTALPTEPRE